MRWLKSLVIALVLVGVVLGGLVFYLKTAAEARFEKTYTVTAAAIPIPFPLTRAEVDEIKRRAARKAAAAVDADGEVEPAGTAPEGAETPAPSQGAQAETAAATKLDLAAIAYQRAVSRGKHYMESRAGCAECHGDDFGGKVLVQSTLAGTLTAPNITRGGVVKSYKAEDWVRVIRHGLKPNGTPAAMPSELYASFSDQEISDMVAYLRSVPAVDRTLAASKLGPLMWFRIVRGDTPISAELIDHAVQRPKSPPPTSKATEELGKHLAAVCSACHGADLAGGPVPGGDSDWPPAKNLTPHANGLEKWSLDDFEKALREGTRPDGGRIDPPMPVKYTKNFKDTEVESLYVYLKTLPAKEAGAH